MSSNTATVTCWVVLLLTMLPLRTLAGRHLPAGPRSASSRQTAPAARHVGRGGALGFSTPSLGDAGTQFQQDTTPPPHRKILVGFKDVKRRDVKVDSIYGHRLLVGSSPPSCHAKCGTCYPCHPIHISIGSPHGALTQQEYYPEVWRCTCGNRLYMP